MWDYITAAQPNTALHYEINKGWTISDDLAAAGLYELRKLGWRYTAMHFEHGTEAPFPEPIYRPGVEPDPEPEPGPANWSQVDNIIDLIPPHVRELLKGA